LLPPGWVALGFLLLLGCQALLAHRRQLQLPSILRLQMPIPERMVIEIDNTYAKDFKLFTKPLADIKPETHWATINFNGRRLNDFVNGAIATTAVRSADADTIHAAGVKVCFQSGTTYGSVVAMLDLMERTGHRSYWLDIEHQPTAFYVVNDLAIKHDDDGLEDAPPVKARTCYVAPIEEYQPSSFLFSSWTKHQQDFTNLWQQPWQPVALLIASIAALSFYRLARPRPSIR
jgi:hypothetical protein